MSFPQYGEKPNIATIGIKEEDLMIISKMDARVNERIKAQFEDSGNSAKTLSEKPDDLSGYLIWWKRIILTNLCFEGKKF